MKELVETIAKALVDSPDEVVVTEKETDKTIVLELKVATDDVGKIIGKQERLLKQFVLLLRLHLQNATKKL